MVRVRTSELPHELNPDSISELAHRLKTRWSELSNAASESEGLDMLALGLDELRSDALRALFSHLNFTFDVVAIGDAAIGESVPWEPAEWLILMKSSAQLDRAGQAALELSAAFDALADAGVPIPIRLREWTDCMPPAQVRTEESFRLYSLASITLLERYEFGASRLIHGSSDARELVVDAAFRQPMDASDVDHLLRLKRFIENERVPIKHATRDVNLGIGGLTDIEWMVRLHEMRFPDATAARQEATLDERIRAMGRAKLLNALETETLCQARRHLSHVRTRIALFGFTPNVLPENPARLDRIGRSFGFADGNAFLAEHEQVTNAVRAIYNEGVERLRA